MQAHLNRHLHLVERIDDWLCPHLVCHAHLTSTEDFWQHQTDSYGYTQPQPRRILKSLSLQQLDSGASALLCQKPQCGREFGCIEQFIRHSSVHQWKQCPTVGCEFSTTATNLFRNHLARKHNLSIHKCKILVHENISCQIAFDSCADLLKDERARKRALLAKPHNASLKRDTVKDSGHEVGLGKLHYNCGQCGKSWRSHRCFQTHHCSGLALETEVRDKEVETGATVEDISSGEESTYSEAVSAEGEYERCPSAFVDFVQACPRMFPESSQSEDAADLSSWLKMEVEEVATTPHFSQGLPPPCAAPGTMDSYTVDQDDKVPRQCPEGCGTVMATWKALRQHLISTHNKSPFICRWSITMNSKRIACAKAFPDGPSLQRHQESHTLSAGPHGNHRLEQSTEMLQKGAGTRHKTTKRCLRPGLKRYHLRKSVV